MFEERESQVFGEEVGEIPNKANFNARFTIQEHDAHKAGKHYDYRLVIGGKAYSWASRYLPPKTTTDRFYIIRQPDHKADYATWSGDIPKGEYGAGRVSVILNTDVVVIKSGDNNIKMAITDGEFEGVYNFLKKDGDNWIVVRNKELTYDWAEKQHYPSKISDTMWNDPNVIASEKKDGASVIAKVTSNKGLGIASVRKSTDGGLIIKNNLVPHLAYAKSPDKYDGMVFRGELYFENQPFSVLSGVLNSKPKRALEAQERLGEKIKLAPFDILKLPGGEDPSTMSYDQKLKLLEDFSKDINSDEVQVPNYTVDNKKEFYENIISNGGEGVVLTHKDNQKFFKVKKEETYTLKIVDFTEGEGRFQGRGIGTFVVEDGKGRRVGRVGSGLTDQIRLDAYRNFEQYRGKLIKVKMMEPTQESIRAPRFVGWDIEKSEPDVMPF